MAHAISTTHPDPLDEEAPPPAHRHDTSTPPDTGVRATQDEDPEPLLRAVALQRPVLELVQLATILNEANQSRRAQDILDIAAVHRPVEDLAALIPRLTQAQATDTLHTASRQRPVAELATLVTLLDDNGHTTHTRQTLHYTAGHRPVDELAQLVGHLYGNHDTTPPTPPTRWKRRH